MLTISNLSHAFYTDNALTVSHYEESNRIPLFEQVNLSLPQGSSLAITGPSGSGKSSLLHMIGALLSPEQGDITFQPAEAHTPLCISSMSESDADHYRTHTLGMVFQRFNLIDFLNVFDNIALTAQHKGNFDEAHIEQLMQQLNITALAQKTPTQLSGGEQQRVAIARALAHKPSIVLADEPTGNLDPATSTVVSQLLYNLSESQGVTLVVVTHSEDVASGAMMQAQVNERQLSVSA